MVCALLFSTFQAEVQSWTAGPAKHVSDLPGYQVPALQPTATG